MAIIRKEKYMKDIAIRIGRGSMFFEAEDRPSLMMGGRQVFVSSVGFDLLSGEMTYQVSNSKGEILPSAKGVRPLAELDVKSLSGIDKVVGEYADLRRSRTRNLINVESRLRLSSKNRPAKSLTI